MTLQQHKKEVLEEFKVKLEAAYDYNEPFFIYEPDIVAFISQLIDSTSEKTWEALGEGWYGWEYGAEPNQRLQDNWKAWKGEE